MPYNVQFGEFARALIAGRPSREIAEAVGFSHTIVSDMARRGYIPRPHTLKQFADGLRLSVHERRQLFALAGYRDPDEPSSEPVVAESSDRRWLPPSLEEGFNQLSPEDQNLLEQLARTFIVARLKARGKS